MILFHRYVRDKQVAVLWVTHDKDEIQHADKVITFNAICRRDAGGAL
ncbi:ABC transporter ATP-binding protein [Salmonella enterica subsp. enterica]|uniref:ABC transporter ATP-binding protein n=1 Tax=Salmonella enterica I TaxID=59201 RepID=A0A447U887_SALET|nr:ABC transporter ATP-binding protein [Salmonella enterica subsp. enterica]